MNEYLLKLQVESPKQNPLQINKIEQSGYKMKQVINKRDQTLNNEQVQSYKQTLLSRKQVNYNSGDP